MEILLWLVPAAVVTTVAMLVVGWVGREDRGKVGREEAARLLGEALTSEGRRPGYAAPRRTPERSSGVAVRASRQRPVLLPGEAQEIELEPDVEGVVVREPETDENTTDERRAS